MSRTRTPEDQWPVYLHSMDQVLEVIQKLSEAHLLLGFGSSGQYDDVAAVVDGLTPSLDAITQRLEGKPWLLLYGGDNADERNPDVGLLAKRIADRYQCKVMAPVIRLGPQLPAPQPFIHYYYVMDPQYEEDLESQVPRGTAGQESGRGTGTAGSGGATTTAVTAGGGECLDAGTAGCAPLGDGADCSGTSSVHNRGGLLGKRRQPEEGDSWLQDATAMAGKGGTADGCAASRPRLEAKSPDQRPVQGQQTDAARQACNVSKEPPGDPGLAPTKEPESAQEPAANDAAVANVSAVAGDLASREAEPASVEAGENGDAQAAGEGKGSGDGGVSSGGDGSGGGGSSGSGRRIVWGGVVNGRPAGPSAMYLDDRMIIGSDGRSRLITSVLVAGGGDIARQELEYIASKGVPWEYVRSKPKNELRGGEFGPVDEWYLQRKDLPRAAGEAA